MIDKEKVRDLAKHLMVNWQDALQFEEIITEWLEENPIEPIVIGLSDEQFMDFCVNRTSANDSRDLLKRFKNWQKTQTFTQQNNFSIDWNDAPPRADEATITLGWYRYGVCIEGKHLMREQRPKPKQQVEVGHVWRGRGYGEVKVIGVSDIQVSAQYLSGNFKIFEIDDFLAKFEQVQP